MSDELEQAAGKLAITLIQSDQIKVPLASLHAFEVMSWAITELDKLANEQVMLQEVSFN